MSKRERAPDECSVTVMHWNVFEDGLADTPSALSFPPEFTARLDTLLAVLCRDGHGIPLVGFSTTRDFSQLPEVRPLDSSAAFFGCIDVLYNAVYHPLGGSLRLGTAAPGAPPDLGNTLRTLFLRAAIREPREAPSSSNPWSTPLHKAELEKAAARLADAPAAAALRADIGSLTDGVLDARHGLLSWDAATHAMRLWKRQANVWRDKWERHLRLFLRPPASMDDAARAALRLFCRVVEAPAQGAGGGGGGGVDDCGGEGGGLSSLIEARLDGEGNLVRLRTYTLQSAVRWLLERLLAHSSSNASAAEAVRRFLGGRPSQPADAASLVFSELAVEIEAWADAVSLTRRHKSFCETVGSCRPSIVSLVEYDAEWRRLPLPTADGRSYVRLGGKGDASLLYDANEFDVLADDFLVGFPKFVRSEFERGAGLSTVAPKSSCLAVLQQREHGGVPGVKLVVASVHLTSGKPSDGRKVAARAAELRALLAELSLINRRRHYDEEYDPGIGIIVAGDFNCLRDEMVLGNTDLFFASPDVRATLPPLARRAPDAAPVVPPPPPKNGPGGSADRDDAGNLRLRTSLDPRMTLREAAPGVGAPAPTRAGTNQTIDYVLVGGAGGWARNSYRKIHFPTQPVALCTSREAAHAAELDGGLRFAILRWGSDHLPIACETRWRPIET